MTRKETPEEVLKQLNQDIRQAKHGMGYYFALALLLFAIPLYVLLQFFYVYAGGWELHDLFLVLALFAVAIYGLYTDRGLRAKLPLWFSVLGVVSVIAITILQLIIDWYYLKYNRLLKNVETRPLAEASSTLRSGCW